MNIIDGLHSASRWLESWADRHEHVISLLEAISTTAAVVVALWSTQMARSASKSKLRAKVQVMQIIGTGIETRPTYIVLRLTNIGNVPIRLHSTCFAWRVSSGKTSWLALPVDERGDENLSQRSYPFVLLPNTSDALFLTSLKGFHEGMSRILTAGKMSPAQGARKLQAIVYTDDGSLFQASVDADVRKEIGVVPSS